MKRFLRETAAAAGMLAAGESAQGADWGRIADAGGRILERGMDNNSRQRIEQIQAQRDILLQQARTLERVHDSDNETKVRLMEVRVRELNLQLEAMRIAAETQRSVSSSGTSGAGMRVDIGEKAGSGSGEVKKYGLGTSLDIMQKQRGAATRLVKEGDKTYEQFFFDGEYKSSKEVR